MPETRTPQPDVFADSSEQASQNGASPCPAPGRVNASVSLARSTANCRQQQFFLACFTHSVPTCRHVQRAGYGVFFARKELFDSHVGVTRVGLVHDQRRLWSVVLASSVVPDVFAIAT